MQHPQTIVIYLTILTIDTDLNIHRAWVKKKFQNVSYYNSTNITSKSMNDRFLKRGHMYHSKMVLYIFQCTLVPEKNREIEKTDFHEITHS